MADSTKTPPAADPAAAADKSAEDAARDRAARQAQAQLDATAELARAQQAQEGTTAEDDARERAARQAAAQEAPKERPKGRFNAKPVSVRVLKAGDGKVSRGQHIGGVGEDHYERGEVFSVATSIAQELEDRGFVEIQDGE
jgi:FKBP-type peptidyl-prolyl cis-trans isomerase